MKISSRISSFAIVMIATAVSGVALAETNEMTVKLAQVEGNVMINQGVNYARATPGTELKTGAKVVTAKGASVSVVYKDGCVKKLKENSILTVGLATECTAKKVNERVYLAEAVGEVATDAPSAGAGSVGGGVAGAGGITTGMVVAGVAVAGAAAVAVASNNNNNASAQ